MGENVLGRRERPSLQGGSRAAAVPCQGRMWQRPVLGVVVLFLQCQPRSRSFSQKKGTLGFTTTNLPAHPSPLSKNWEKREDFPTRAVVSTSRPCRSFGLPQPGTKPSASWFFLLGSGGLLGDEALGGNVWTLLGFSGWNPWRRFAVLGMQGVRLCCLQPLTAKYFGIWGK